MYKCNNCGHVAPRDEMKDAQDLLERMEVGDVFTDKECPECGALAQPVDEPDDDNGPTDQQIEDDEIEQQISRAEDDEIERQIAEAQGEPE